MKSLTTLLSILLLTSIFIETSGQRRSRSESTNSVEFDRTLYQDMHWRNIGPFRGGRSTTATGVTSQPLTYYFGSTGGGVWKTINAGNTWTNVSDGFFNTGSVGAIAVAESDPNVVYVGMGEACVRGVMTSSGDGMYKSTDAGKTWIHLGLESTLHISRIMVHPENAEIVYVAALGNPYQPSPERGIYRSIDGGKTWEKILYVSDKAGASDLKMDMTNPRIIYAAFWEHQRTPWQVISGGDGSGIYKSSDGGDTWKKLVEGLPEGIMGKIGIAVSRANPQKIWAVIEAEKGGLYRSDDGGRKWKLINGDRVLQARSWYYMHVFADPGNENIVYVLNAPVLKSIDGGKSFSNVTVPHGDNHDLWINPKNSDIMINANDGGANISFNEGISWSLQSNQPTVQFYRVNTDNQFPYWVYGGQQDNSSVAVPSRAPGSGIGREDWIAGVGGCESAFTAFDPDNPEYVYAGCYQGIISEWDRKTRKSKDIMAYPYLGLGSNSKDAKFRFNWNAPIHVSLHNTSIIYHAGNKLLKSSNRGLSWEEISPDLTRNDTTKQGWGGSPITNEGAGGEVYGTIMYIAESPHDARVIWAGSDDGLVHITRNGGGSWQNVTPPGMKEFMVNSIEASPHDPGTAYLSVTGYKFGDFNPYVYKSTDFGQSWKLTVTGIPNHHFIRVVREDPERKDLLYAGTERGLYISFDGGTKWNNFQLDLPVVPITDLKITHGDLVAATQGRAFWILDDLSPLHELRAGISGSTSLFSLDQVYITDGFRNKNANKNSLGENPYHGAAVRYLMPVDSESDSTEFKIEFSDSTGDVLRTFSRSHPQNRDTVSYKSGMNTVYWDLRSSSMETPKGLQPFGSTSGPQVIPGTYKVTLWYGEQMTEKTFEIIKDPRYPGSEMDYSDKEKMVSELDEIINNLYASVIELYSVRKQVSAFNDRFNTIIDESDSNSVNELQELVDAGESILEHITDLESVLVQPKQKTFQDVINFPNQLDAHILHLRSTIDGNLPPITDGEKTRFADLKTEWEVKKAEISKLLDEELTSYNQKLADSKVDYIMPSRKQ